MKDVKIEIDPADLKAQVTAFLAGVRSDERPEHRIVRVVAEMRRYKAEVVKAVLPRGNLPDPPADRLREHREAYRAAGCELNRLRAWLTTRDTAYLLGPAVHWRLDDVDWEGQVWSPLAGWAESGYGMLFAGADGPGWPRPVPPEGVRAWEAEELELEHRLLARVALFVPVSEPLVLDPNEEYTIRWKDTPCRLGDTDLFRIMRRLVRARGRKVALEDIALDLGNEEYTEEAFRQAVTRLKKKLRTGGLTDLAGRIRTAERGRYVYVESPTTGDPAA